MPAGIWEATPGRSGPCTPRSEPAAAVTTGAGRASEPLHGTRCVPTLCLGSVLQTLLGEGLKESSSRGHSPEKAGSTVSARLEPAFGVLSRRRQQDRSVTTTECGKGNWANRKAYQADGPRRHPRKDGETARGARRGRTRTMPGRR